MMAEPSENVEEIWTARCSCNLSIQWCERIRNTIKYWFLMSAVNAWAKMFWMASIFTVKIRFNVVPEWSSERKAFSVISLRCSPARYHLLKDEEIFLTYLLRRTSRASQMLPSTQLQRSPKRLQEIKRKIISDETFTSPPKRNFNLFFYKLDGAA